MSWTEDGGVTSQEYNIIEEYRQQLSEKNAEIAELKEHLRWREYPKELPCGLQEPVLIKTSLFICEAWFCEIEDTKEWVCCDDVFTIQDCEVTHWLPIPQMEDSNNDY